MAGRVERRLRPAATPGYWRRHVHKESARNTEPLRHRQTKGAATDMFYLTPPRHISTLPNSPIQTWPLHVGWSPNRCEIVKVGPAEKVREGLTWVASVRSSPLANPP